MALTGTLKDFGIADILQLIGQQQKTGVLYLKSKEQEVQVFFRDGAIVRADRRNPEKGPLGLGARTEDGGAEGKAARPDPV